MFQDQANQRDLQALVEPVLTGSTLTRKGGSERVWAGALGPGQRNKPFYPMNLLARNRGFKETRIFDWLNLKQTQMKARTMVTVPMA